MIDIETTGTDAAHAAMIQLSAVAFDLDNREVHPKMFDQCLLMPKNRFWDEDTRNWWASQPPHILEGIWARMRDQRSVLLEFNTWLAEVTEGSTPIMWAKPISFEWPFLQAYFRDYEVALPFFYSDCQDLRSWCRARGLEKLDREVEVVGDAHNALHDVLHQINVLFSLLERTNVQQTS